MINEKTTKKIQNLLREGRHSQRKVALLCGVSRSAVQRILRQSSRATRKPGRPARHSDIPGNGEFIPPHGKHRRCPGCGGLVQMPCLACQLRQKSMLKKGKS